MPSTAPTSRHAASIAASSTAIAKPSLSRTARRMRKSPSACGTRMPAAKVWAFSQRGAEGVGVPPARPGLDPVLPSLDHWLAAGGLDRDHARPLLADPAHRLEL